MGTKFVDDVDCAFDRITLRSASRPPPLPVAPQSNAHPNITSSAVGTRWFLAIGDGIATVDLEGLRERWNRGELTPDSLAWRPGLSSWVRLATVAELRDAIAPLPSAPGEALLHVMMKTPLSLEAKPEDTWMPTAGEQMDRLLRGETRPGAGRIAQRLRVRLARRDDRFAVVRVGRQPRRVILGKPT
jgi:hypothetical protein